MKNANAANSSYCLLTGDCIQAHLHFMVSALRQAAATVRRVTAINQNAILSDECPSGHLLTSPNPVASVQLFGQG
jgi:hypothetical protein